MEKAREHSDDTGLKDAAFIRLWDVYNPLLTPRQREITDLYFNYDLSLAEIAEQKGVSRQSVSDCLGKSRKILEEYEKKLSFAKMLDDVCLDFSFYMTRVGRWLDEQREKHPEWAGEIDSLREALDREQEERGSEAIETENGTIWGKSGYRKE